MLRADHIASGSVVLLSDGGERGSAATVQQVTAAASDAGVRVFGVGLPSRHAHFASLNLLALGTGGEFSSVASTSDLTRVYDRLGSRLAGQYLIRYRSAAAPGARVRVAVSAPGMATARTRYETPAAPSGARPPFHRAPGEALWLSPAGTLLTGLLAGALLAVALWLMLRPRRGTMRARLAAYVRPVTEGEAASSGELTGRMLQSAERSLEQTAWGPRLAVWLDIAGVGIAPARLVAYVVTGTLLALVLFGAAAGPAAALLAFVVPGATWALISRRVERRRRRFAEQLPDNLQVIASAMRAGHSFSGALAAVVDDAPEPTRAELQRVIADERLGVPVEEALGVVVRRMANKDLEQVALVAALQRETGGNTAEVLDRATETVRERLALRRMVRTLTAQGRMSRWIVSLLPAGLLGIITLINPDYVRPLYTTSFGHIALVIAAVMVVSGSLVIRRIVDIKV
jgi:tight adherence protein B